MTRLHAGMRAAATPGPGRARSRRLTAASRRLPAPEEPASPTPAARRSHLADLDAPIEALLRRRRPPARPLTIATAVDRPVAVVRQAVERIRDDYDGPAGGRRRGFELREVGGGWRLYVRAELRRGGARHLLERERPGCSPGRARDARRDRLQAADQPRARSRPSAPSTSTPCVRTLLGRGLITEVGRRQRDRRDQLRHDRRPAAQPARHQLARRAARRSRRCSSDGAEGFARDAR